MSFPRYPKYKASGVEWLGDVPEHWDISRLGFESWVRARLGWKGLKAEEYVDDGFAFLSTPNIKGAEIDFENVNFIDQVRFDESPEIKLREGDVLLAKDGSTLGTVNIVRSLPRPTTVNSSIAVITPNARLAGVFLYYLFESSYMENTIQRIKGGMGVPHLFQEDLNKFYLPLPSQSEQTLIASFLDRETAKIEGLVGEQRRLIELLKEKRQAVISHAVTKGLNPRAPLKPSGIEWLGDVPEHWEVVRLKYAITKIEQGWSPQCDNEPALDDEWGVLKVGCGNRDEFDPTEQKALPLDLAPLPEYEIKPGDILMSRGNTRDLVGMATLVRRVRPRLLLCDLLYRFHAQRESVESEFLVFSLRSANVRFQIEREATGTSASMKKIGQGTIREFVICLPPLDEQREIGAFINALTAKLDALTTEAERAIELLQERRTALISAAVTGKIDVRGWAAAEVL